MTAPCPCSAAGWAGQPGRTVRWLPPGVTEETESSLLGTQAPATRAGSRHVHERARPRPGVQPGRPNAPRARAAGLSLSWSWSTLPWPLSLPPPKVPGSGSSHTELGFPAPERFDPNSQGRCSRCLLWGLGTDGGRGASLSSHESSGRGLLSLLVGENKPESDPPSSLTALLSERFL